MIPVTGTLALDEALLEWRFVQASGPGGQNVNKVATAVQLRLDLARWPLPGAMGERLARLAGRRHRVLTGVVLLTRDGGRSERVVESVVGFARLRAARHGAYLESGEWEGKAGGYAIQGRAAAFVRFLSGSYSGVVGLPLFETAQLLRGHGHPPG